jgi:hypothetical protein
MTTLKDYERVKNALKKKFEVERSGEQSLYFEQSKLFKPLIDEQKESTKTIQHNITSGQDSLTNALVPFTEELRKRNDQVDNPQSLPFYNALPEIENIPQSTPKKDISLINVNLDKMLNETDRENLQDMSLPLPGEVIKEGNYDFILERVKTLNRLGQYTGKKSKKDEREKQMYKSRRETLEMYEMSLKEQMKALKYKTGEGLRKRKLHKMKRGRGRPKKYPDTKFYNSPDDLVEELNKLVLTKEAGHTSLDNIIISALDELLNIKAITKNEFDKLYKNIF